MITDTWPPAYKVRKSKRAKKLVLTITPHKGVEVVIPYYATYKEAHSFVETQRPWIETELQKIAQQHLVHNPNKLPSEIFLRSIEQLWQIEYIADNKRARLSTCEQTQHLFIKGDFEQGQWKKLLKSWLVAQARKILPPWLHEVSVETNLAYQEVSVRGQNTLWGSCSSHKRISLNYKLLFLPDKLVENVILHELCHTVYLNHSQKFWNLMLQHNEHTLLLDEQLKNSDKYMPVWLDVR